MIVFEKVKPGELAKEFEDWNKHLKMTKKKEYMKPMPALIESEKCRYEKIRETIVQERLKAMEESGLFENFDEMKAKIYKEKLNIH